MKPKAYRQRKISCLLLLILLFLSVLDKKPEIPSINDISYLGYTKTASNSYKLETDNESIPDFIHVEGTLSIGHGTVLSRTTVKRLTNTRTALICHEITDYHSFCILSIFLILLLTSAIVHSCEFIIQYIHDKDGCKNNLLYN